MIIEIDGDIARDGNRGGEILLRSIRLSELVCVSTRDAGVDILVQGDGLSLDGDGSSSERSLLLVLDQRDLDLVLLVRAPGLVDGIGGGGSGCDLEVDHMDACSGVSECGTLGNGLVVDFEAVSGLSGGLEDDKHRAVVHIFQIFARKDIDHRFRRVLVGHVSGGDDSFLVIGSRQSRIIRRDRRHSRQHDERDRHDGERCEELPGGLSPPPLVAFLFVFISDSSCASLRRRASGRSVRVRGRHPPCASVV